MKRGEGHVSNPTKTWGNRGGRGKHDRRGINLLLEEYQAGSNGSQKTGDRLLPLVIITRTYATGGGRANQVNGNGKLTRKLYGRAHTGHHGGGGEKDQRKGGGRQ